VVWLGMVFPALLLNYLGQGALLLAEPTAVDNPFFRLVPSWFLYPMLVIATLAAIVASQAMISGAFSLTQQAVQLGYSPRVTIVHTSKQEAGQIYIPEVNKALALGTLLLIFGFGSSTAIGGAYGVAVTGTMTITTILFCAIARERFSECRSPRPGVFPASISRSSANSDPARRMVRSQLRSEFHPVPPKAAHSPAAIP
jgi:KUP system potassium uptake protein